MRSIQRGTTAVVLVLVLAMPAGAASRSSSRSAGLVQAVKRFVIRAMSRISPPIGSPDLPTEDPTITTTDAPVRTQ